MKTYKPLLLLFGLASIVFNVHGQDSSSSGSSADSTNSSGSSSSSDSSNQPDPNSSSSANQPNSNTSQGTSTLNARTSSAIPSYVIDGNAYQFARSGKTWYEVYNGVINAVGDFLTDHPACRAKLEGSRQGRSWVVMIDSLIAWDTATGVVDKDGKPQWAYSAPYDGTLPLSWWGWSDRGYWGAYASLPTSCIFPPYTPPPPPVTTNPPPVVIATTFLPWELPPSHPFFIDEAVDSTVDIIAKKLLQGCEPNGFAPNVLDCQKCIDKLLDPFLAGMVKLLGTDPLTAEETKVIRDAANILCFKLPF